MLSFEFLSLFICGASGALVKDLLHDNKLIMPKILKGEMVLGFVGSLIIGGFVGYFVDHSPITAFFSGFTGFSALSALMPGVASVPATPGPLSSPIIENEKKVKAFTILKPFLGNYPITQKFGENPAWYSANGYAGHFGIDYATPWDTPIIACDSGVVSRAGRTAGNGFFCELKHSWGTSLYCHFNKISALSIGQPVNRGDVVGFAGNTGAVRPAPTTATPKAGTHCHFSITISGVSNKPFKNFIDPSPFFADTV